MIQEKWDGQENWLEKTHPPWPPPPIRDIVSRDNVLKDLLETAKALPQKRDDRKDESFEQKINSTGWHLVKNLMVEHEMLIIALMSISSFNLSTIKNRHQWHNFKEQNQNRCARQPIYLFCLTLFQGNGVLQALDDIETQIQTMPKRPDQSYLLKHTPYTNLAEQEMVFKLILGWVNQT